MEPAPEQQQPEQPGLLQRLRNCWEFANLMQFIYTFGKVLKIDEDFDIEDLETECLKPGPSEKLLDIGLCMLKFVSSHRGLTRENFDEYTRRQYNAKAPHLPNPFGYDEEPKKFNDFDIFLKLRVLHQLSVWTFWNPDRMREKMPEQREIDQTQWRIEELGYDRYDRYYYVLDDNRLYRRTNPPAPPARAAKPKANTKRARAAARAAKRRRLSEAAEEDEEEEKKEDLNEEKENAQEEDTFGGYKWECIAITLAEYEAFIDTIRKTRDPNEQILRDRLIEQVLPVIQKAEEARQRKIAKREKELLNMQLLATAKRSSRIASRMERERQEREAAEAARKREAELEAARKEEERRRKMEAERQHRIMTREQRIREREQKRLLHEAELARMEEEKKKLESGESRMSERHLKVEMEKRKKSLEELAQEDLWFFDCSGCGVHGANLDDGTHSVACERCNVWQHSKCLGIPQDVAEKDDFHFICDDCKRREEEAKRPKIPPLKFRINTSTSPPSDAAAVNGEKRKSEEDQTSPSTKRPKDVDVPHPSEVGNAPPAAEPTTGVSNTQTGSISEQPAPPQTNGVQQTAPNPPSSPERRLKPAVNGSLNPSSSLHAPSSPSQAVNGVAPSPTKYPPKFIPNEHSSQPVQEQFHQPPPSPHRNLTNAGPLNSQRPSSSHSTYGQAFPSPIQNRPSMSPTQGNHDVGPLAGIPSSALSNGSVPGTPFGHSQTPQSNVANFAPPSSSHSRHPSFSAATPSGSNSFYHSPPPQGSQGMPMSGLSPTKHSPRPMASGNVGNASVVPPVQRLQPSPKLMGRSSPDAPIPPPVKSMTPEQEERRQRENEMMAQTQASNGQQVPSLQPSFPPSTPVAQQPRQSQPVQPAVQHSQGFNAQ